MHSFNPEIIKNLELPIPVVWLVGQCMELRGKQDLWMKTKPEVMKTLKEIAIIQSVESSNRIEGVTVSKNRLKPLVLNQTKPKDRPEEEIYGYKKALDWIHRDFKKINIDPKAILKLHELAQGGHSSDAGRWKTKNNEIIEILPNGERIIRFVPVVSEKTPKYMEQLCLAYQDVLQKKQLPELLIIASFVFDFLCIHPFRDGNGRVSRLLTLLLLYQHGFDVGRYISIERIIESTKQDYYQVLHNCSQGWHESQHDIKPWWIYFLSTLKEAYRELSNRVEGSDLLAPKGRVIEGLILEQTGEFTLSTIQNLCPNVSQQMIKKVLNGLKIKKKVQLVGKGRGAKCRVLV